MGGGPRIPYPTAVYTPVGGWYSNPKNAKRNTFIGIGIALAATIPVFLLNSNFERRPTPGIFAIPSQSWSRYTRIDDPEYDAKLAKRSTSQHQHHQHHEAPAVVEKKQHIAAAPVSIPEPPKQQQQQQPTDWNNMNNLLKNMPDSDAARMQFLQDVQDKKL